MRKHSLFAMIVGPLLALSACGSDETNDGTAGSPTPTPKASATLGVTLQEFAVIPDAASVSAGAITFNATNKGPDDAHELVVFRTDLDPGALPLRADGAVDEEGTGVTLIDEIEEFAPGSSESMTVDLSAGKYALICNLVETDAGKVEVHYKLGMRAALTVT